VTLVVELTNSGMDYCFLKPLLLAKVGFVIQQSANLGVAGATRIMAPMIRNIIARLDQAPVIGRCRLYPAPDGYAACSLATLHGVIS
jgi:hypothetical protein